MNKRVNSISSSKNVFDAAIPPYQKALDESAYTSKLTYNPQPAQKRNKNRLRVIWYNRMKTSLARRFLNIVYRCLPKSPITQDL